MLMQKPNAKAIHVCDVDRLALFPGLVGGEEALSLLPHGLGTRLWPSLFWPLLPCTWS